MTASHILSGNNAEDAALGFLLARGFILVARNFRCKAGELDLIVKDPGTLVFVEVRYRQDASRGTGAETITRSKMAKLIKAAQFFLQKNPGQGHLDCRFDVISITTDIDWIQNAFTLDDHHF
jgi:putative endonuclease